MPELPELELLKENLTSRIAEKKITAFKIIKPYILKTFTPTPDKFVGDKFIKISHRGKYLILESISDLKLVIHLMLAGRIEYCSSVKRISRDNAALISFEDATHMRITEFGSKKRACIYIVRELEQVAKLRELGIEPLSESFTVEALTKLLNKQSCQLKSFLTHQNLIAGIGNAYADEILWQAKLSPFKNTTGLKSDEISRFYDAIKSVLIWSIEEIKKNIGNSLPQKEARNFLRVYKKKGESCPRCGTTIQWVSYTNRDTYYCPACQTGGKILADRRYSRFLK
jgi:formamidopyrimidine-DNA glycosylase